MDVSALCFGKSHIEMRHGGRGGSGKYHFEGVCPSLVGYMEVVNIPKGSVHIAIKEVSVSKNYIGK